MAITFVSSAEQASTNDATPLSFAFDIGTRTNGLLVVMLAVVDTVTHTQANPTWAGAAMATAISEVAEVTTNVWFRTSIYYLSNPTNGSNTFSVDYDDGGTDTATAVFICAAWVDGAAQSSALDQAVGGNGSTDPSVDIVPTQNNEIVFCVYMSNQGTLLTAGGETLIQDHDFGTRVAGASYIIQTTAGSQTMNWTGNDAPWKMVTASFKELAAAGGVPKHMMHYQRMCMQ